MYTDDLLRFESKYTNEYLLIDSDYNFDILWISCRNNCIHFLKKMINNKDKDENKKKLKIMYESSLSKNNVKISSFLFDNARDILYKDIYLKCIVNNSKKSLSFLKDKKISISDFNEEYLVSECLRVGNYKLAKSIIKQFNIEYESLMYYIYVKTINVKMLIWLLNKIGNKEHIKFINIFNYINEKEFRKLFKIIGELLINEKYFNKCIFLKKYNICKIMIDNNNNNLYSFNSIYNNNTKKIKI